MNLSMVTGEETACGVTVVPRTAGQRQIVKYHDVVLVPRAAAGQVPSTP